MKRLVLSEGRRDVRLVELFYETATTETSVDTFYGEDVSYERLKSHESEKIRNFLERRNPYDVLVKSENGKPDLKRVFSKLASFLVTADVTLVLLIDLDGGSLEELIDDLDTRVEDTYQGRRLGIRDVEQIERNRVLLANRVELYSKSDGHRQGCFDLVAFHEDLETAIGLDSADEDSEEERKLRDLVTGEQSVEPLRSVLSGSPNHS